VKSEYFVIIKLNKNGIDKNWIEFIEED